MERRPPPHLGPQSGPGLGPPCLVTLYRGSPLGEELREEQELQLEQSLGTELGLRRHLEQELNLGRELEQQKPESKQEQNSAQTRTLLQEQEQQGLKLVVIPAQTAEAESRLFGPE